MYISWLGLNCFKIQSQNIVLITDPFDPKTGLKLPRLQADIVTVSQKDSPEFNNMAKISGESFLITGPGEYERKLNGQPLQPDFSTLYYFEVEDIGIGHLGSINHPLTNEQLEVFEGTDILLVPIGGKPALTAEKAAEVISQIEPRIVIPMYYKIPGLKIPLNPLDKFLQVMGIKSPEILPKYKIQKRDLPQEETEIIILQA